MEQASPKITLLEQVYLNIKRDILTNTLKPGEKVNIKELCERYKASETPVRLALNRLASENIIEHFPRQGMRIKPLNINICEETFDVREMLECYYIPNVITTLIVNQSMKNAFKDNVNGNLAVVKQLSADSTPDDYLKNYDYDIEFHNLLIKCAGNQMLVDMYKQINPFLYVNYVYSKQSQERLMTGIKEHESILDALLSADAKEAVERIKKHLHNSKQAIISILKIDHIF